MDILLGCGNSRQRCITVTRSNWDDLITVDIDPSCGADVLHDINVIPLPFADNYAEEIHCYNVLEHLGTQGDFKFFFSQFEDFWRILVPGGFLCATVPIWNDLWAWSDPGHTRVISKGTIYFLDQRGYEDIGSTMMTDYRWCYKGNFRLVNEYTDPNGTYFFILQAIK
jgi:hypothetical protein